MIFNEYDDGENLNVLNFLRHFYFVLIYILYIFSNKASSNVLEKLIFNISDKLGNIKEGLFGKKGDRGGLLQKIFGITKWVVGAPLLVGFLSKFKHYV